MIYFWYQQHQMENDEGERKNEPNLIEVIAIVHKFQYMEFEGNQATTHQQKKRRRKLKGRNGEDSRRRHRKTKKSFRLVLAVLWN